MHWSGIIYTHFEDKKALACQDPQNAAKMGNRDAAKELSRFCAHNLPKN